MKRIFIIAALALSLATPAHAVGPLGMVVINYFKQVLKDKIIAYAKEKAGEALGDVPGGGLLGLVPGAMQRPAMSSDARDAISASGFNDVKAKPLSEAEWKEYEDTVALMAKAAGAGPDDMPDVAEMRKAAAAMPQFNGMIRKQYDMFHEMKAEQARMREAYASMSEVERQEVLAELVRNFREQPAEYHAEALKALLSDVFGFPDDLKQRLRKALAS